MYGLQKFLCYLNINLPRSTSLVINLLNTNTDSRLSYDSVFTFELNRNLDHLHDVSLKIYLDSKKILLNLEIWMRIFEIAKIQLFICNFLIDFRTSYLIKEIYLCVVKVVDN